MNRKKSKYYLGTPKLKTKLLWIYSVRKNIQCSILSCFGVFTPTQLVLSCKIPKFSFYADRKKCEEYLGALNLIENGSEYSLLEKIYNALFYFVLEYIHQFSMHSQVKYKTSKFTQIEKNLNII